MTDRNFFCFRSKKKDKCLQINSKIPRQTSQQRVLVTLILVDRTLCRLLLSLYRLLDLVSLAFTSYLRRTGREPVTVSLTIGKYIESHSSGAKRTSLALAAGHWYRVATIPQAHWRHHWLEWRGLWLPYESHSYPRQICICYSSSTSSLPTLGNKLNFNFPCKR